MVRPAAVALPLLEALMDDTTRRYFHGVYRVELLINGRVEAQADFALTC